MVHLDLASTKLTEARMSNMYMRTKLAMGQHAYSAGMQWLLLAALVNSNSSN